VSSPAEPVTVVIPNWNGRDRLPGTLAALRAQTRPPERVLVVDNGSTDGSADDAAAAGVEVVRLDRNAGYGAAANAGLRCCATPNLAVLNSDARPEPTWLEQLAADGPTGAHQWAWGSVLVSPLGAVESAGDFVRWSGLSGKHLGGRPLEDLPDAPFPVLAPPGAAPLLRADVVRDLGGWFEPYFLYYEDLDLALRARLRGWRCHVVPRARVVHDLAGSSGGAPPWDLIARSSTWCAVRANPALSLRGLARLHIDERRVARYHGRGWRWAWGKARALPALPQRMLERRAIMAGATDRAWVPGPPDSPG